jgi:hypothetical protein
MKKYLLLFTLFCATFAMGTLLFNEAHKNTSIASISDESTTDKGLLFERTEIKESAMSDRENTSTGFKEVSKELIKDASESAAKFIFYLEKRCLIKGNVFLCVISS